MKTQYYVNLKKLALLLIGVLFFSLNSVVLADDEEEGIQKVPDKLKYYKEKYEIQFDSEFQTVFDACKKFIENNLSCQILNSKVRDQEDGTHRGIVRSELCIFSQNESEIFKTIQKYALDAPFIRGGVWTSGRMQYTFIVTEIGDNKINLELRGEMSGFENHVSFKAYFFKSNGLLEQEAFDAITELVNNPSTNE